MAYTTKIGGLTCEHRTYQATLFCEGTGGQWQEIQFQRERRYYDADGKLIDRAIDPTPIIITPETLANNPQGNALVNAVQTLVDDLDKQRRIAA